MPPHLTAADLDRSFGIANVARFEPGNDGLTRLVISTPQADAEIYLHGAHVTEFRPRGQDEVLFLSDKSLFAKGKAIRGGVPIIFPWFGPRAGHPESPQHGLVRTADWSVESLDQLETGEVLVVFRYESNADTRAIWPHDFVLRYWVQVGDYLDLCLEVHNTGVDAFDFEEALHTYLAVSDVRRVEVVGLSNTEYLDKTDGMLRKQQDGQPIRITGETDRVYLNTQSACTAKDPDEGRIVMVEKQNSNATVLWNPWIAKAKAMADFGDEEWPAMLCIETCNVAENAVQLDPKAKHEMRVSITAERLAV